MVTDMVARFHVFHRAYASVHLLLLYLAMCGQLPGLEVLQRPEWERLLRAIGVWDPSLAWCGALHAWNGF